MKYLFIIYILFWNLTGITVAAPDKAQVMGLLEGRHWKLDVESFQLLGDDTDKVLIEIGRDTSLINYLRFRALHALSLFPTENTASFLELYAEKSFAPLARRGFEALKNGFYKTQQAASRLPGRPAECSLHLVFLLFLHMHTYHAAFSLTPRISSTPILLL